MPDTGWWPALFSDPAAILTSVGIGPGMEVVDLCCGDGHFTVPLARLARHVFAIDLDRALLEVARRRLVEAGRADQCDFIEGDAYEIARLVPRPVDFVFLANAFHGVPDKARLSTAVRSALKPGSRFAIVNWHARPREETTVLGEPRGPATELRMAPDDAIAAVEPSGLKLRELVEVPPYHYAAVFERRE